MVMKNHSVYWHMADVWYRVNKFFAKNILRKEQQKTTMVRALEENNTGPLPPWTPPRHKTTMARALEENNTGPLPPWTPPRPRPRPPADAASATTSSAVDAASASAAASSAADPVSATTS